MPKLKETWLDIKVAYNALRNKVYIDVDAWEVARVILWIKKFDFWLSEFQCAWQREIPCDPMNVIAETQQTKSHSTAKYIYLIIIMG